jgi:hypothetical protein
VAQQSDGVQVVLPVGYRDPGGEVHVEAVLSPLTGLDEEALGHRCAQQPLAALITRALLGVVQRVGPYAPMTPDIARALVVADRDYLVLKLRELTLGSRVQLVLACPECGQRMDVDFSLDQIPFGPTRPGRAHDPLAVDGMAFRLPTGGDQEEIAARGELSEAEAIGRLIDMCLLRAEDASRLDADLRQRIEAEMERVAPHLDLELDMTCPECGHVFLEALNVAALFFTELGLQRGHLYREVHRLASAYHWSESDILAMTREKRRLYLELVLNDGTGANGVG